MKNIQHFEKKSFIFEAILATEQIQQPPPAPQIPTAYSLPPSQPLMFHPHPQLTLEMMHPQTILAAAGQRQLFQQVCDKYLTQN